MIIKKLIPIVFLLLLSSTVLAQKDFYFEASSGMIPNYSTNVKFGYNPDIDSGAPEMVWFAGGNKVFLEDAEVLNVSSSDVNDASGDTGAHSVLLFGLDDNFFEISEVVVLNGTTNVQTVNQFRRLDRMSILGAGTSQTNEGSIIATSSVTSSVQGNIETGLGITQMAIFSVPEGKRAFIRFAIFSVVKTSGGSNPKIEFLGKVRNPLTNSTVVPFRVVLDSSVQNYVEINQYVMPPLSGPVDVFMEASSDTNNAEVTARLYYVLVDDDSKITEDDGMSIATILAVIFILSFYVFFLRNFIVELFANKDVTNITVPGVRLGFLILLFWLLLIPQYIVYQTNQFNGGPPGVASLLDILLIAMVSINTFITFYFAIWIGIQWLRKIQSYVG